MTAVIPGQRATSSTCSPRRGASRARPSRPSCWPLPSSAGSTRRRRTTSRRPSRTGPCENGDCEDGAWWCVKTYDSTTTADARSSARRSAPTTRSTPSSRSTSAPSAWRRWRGSSASARRSTSTAPTCRRWGSARSPSRRSISRPRTRRSPPAASTPSRWRSARSCSRTARWTPQAGWGVPQRKRVISRRRRRAVTQVLEDNMRYGTGTRARDSACPAAGKTGTTDHHADAWFAGYTP